MKVATREAALAAQTTERLLANRDRFGTHLKICISHHGAGSRAAHWARGMLTDIDTELRSRGVA
jgi:hypothetical protein